MKITNRSNLLFALLGALALAPRATAQSISGWVPYGHFGWSIAAAGDVNGDGLADVIVGAPDTVNPSTGAQTGAAYVYTASGTLLYTWYGSPGDSFGFSVAGAGDVNGDGRPDLIVGSPNASPGYLRAGRATVFSGANGSVLFTLNSVVPEQHLGYSVAGAGYVDADGFADVIVGSSDEGSSGAPYPGIATVYSGPSGNFLYSWLGDFNGSFFGRAVAGAGDVNGDGRADLIVGELGGNGGAGLVRVFSGATGLELYTLTSAFPGSSFGWSVASAGDVTGDGRADIIVGQPQGTITGLIRGTAQVFDGSSQALVQGWEGATGGELFGFAVASAGDVDRDGRADLLVGVPGDDTYGPDGGGVRIFSGRTGLRLYSVPQGGTGTQAGHSVATLGNAAGGSELEFAFGVPYANWNATQGGGVWIYSEPSIFRFALGDGSGTQCPCGNGSAGSGCANPASASGGRLDACGLTSVSADFLVLAASGLPSSAALFFQGTTQTNNGMGSPFGAGILGVGGSIIRLGVKFPVTGGGQWACLGPFGDNGAGRAAYPEAGDAPISVRGMVPPAGGSRNYQVWYRAAPACNGSTYNLTNGISIAWGP